TVAAYDFVVLSDPSLLVYAPADDTTGAVHVTVTTPTGTSSTSSSDQFTYNDVPIPAVSTVSPNVGSTGGTTSVTITGTDFTNATAVFFGALPATSFTIDSDTQITVV